MPPKVVKIGALGGTPEIWVLKSSKFGARPLFCRSTDACREQDRKNTHAPSGSEDPSKTVSLLGTLTVGFTVRRFADDSEMIGVGVMSSFAVVATGVTRKRGCSPSAGWDFTSGTFRDPFSAFSTSLRFTSL